MRKGFLSGCGTAIVTPFTTDGSIDEGVLRAFVEWQVEQGVHFIVPCGSTGEAATLNEREHRRVVEITVEVVNDRVPVVAGAGANDTAKAIRMSKDMQAIGATHLLQVAPMYNKPPQRGIMAHFRAIADAVTIPTVIYNVPGRTAINISAATTLELAQDERFVAVKEASGNLSQIAQIIRERPKGFAVLSGDDSMTLATYAHGGDGVVSVCSNATPALLAEMCNAAGKGDFDRARKAEAKLAQWFAAAFVESNPIPVKAALAMLGRMSETLRLPLVPLADEYRDTVRSALRAAEAFD